MIKNPVIRFKREPILEFKTLQNDKSKINDSGETL